MRARIYFMFGIAAAVIVILLFALSTTAEESVHENNTAPLVMNFTNNEQTIPQEQEPQTIPQTSGGGSSGGDSGGGVGVQQTPVAPRYDTEGSFGVLIKRHLNISAAAVLVIDVNDDTGDINYTKTNIIPFLQDMRQRGVRIIHLNYGGTAQEGVIDGERDWSFGPELPPLISFLQQEGISELIYTGYLTDVCVMYREAGIVNMKNLNYTIFVKENATLGTNEVLKKETLDLIEKQYGGVLL